jgi:N-acetylglucosaminyl-diphospho-decaprenol L-rhamnosyltransferase
VSVAAVVIVHEEGPELARCVASLEPQVDELVVIRNLVDNERPLGFAANANRGIARTSAPYVVVANPDTQAEADAVAKLAAFASGRARAGIVGPALLNPDGSPQASRRRFPTVTGTLVRRTPLRAVVSSRRHFYADEPTEPVQPDWMLGAFLLLRREMLEELGGFDEGFRLYGEDIDLAYRAAKAGWERWYVPGARVTHGHAAVSDRRFLTRHTLWHWRGIARFVRKHPERLRAL